MESTIDKTKRAPVQQQNTIFFPSMGLPMRAHMHSPELLSVPRSSTIHICIYFCQISVRNNA